MKTISSLVCALLVSAVPATQAAQVRLDGAGFDVIYDDSLVGLFGTPSLLNNLLVFNPTSFSALSSGSAWTLSNSTIGLTLVADQGFTLSGANVTERGDYLRFGASSVVLVAGQTRAYDFRTPSVETTAVIAGADPSVLSVHDLPVVTNWEAYSSQTFASGATEVHLTIENLLGATAGGSGGLAFIEKKYVSLATLVSPVPEAGGCAMLLAGLGLFGLMSARRRAR